MKDNMREDVLKVLVSEEEIREKVKEMGRRITEDYKGKNLLLVTVLKGAVVFLADLMREIDVPAEIDFMVVSSYGGAMIDTDALIDALRHRKFAGVGLDVYEDEDGQVFEDFSNDVLCNQVVPVLLSFPNVVITSHQAFFTRTALQSIAITTMENARAFDRGEPLANEVRA